MNAKSGKSSCTAQAPTVAKALVGTAAVLTAASIALLVCRYSAPSPTFTAFRISGAVIATAALLIAVHASSIGRCDGIALGVAGDVLGMVALATLVAVLAK